MCHRHFTDVFTLQVTLLPFLNSACIVMNEATTFCEKRCGWRTLRLVTHSLHEALYSSISGVPTYWRSEEVVPQTDETNCHAVCPQKANFTVKRDRKYMRFVVWSVWPLIPFKKAFGTFLLQLTSVACMTFVICETPSIDGASLTRVYLKQRFFIFYVLVLPTQSDTTTVLTWNILLH